MWKWQIGECFFFLTLYIFLESNRYSSIYQHALAEKTAIDHDLILCKRLDKAKED